jgi:hypothetical protein
MKNKVGIVESVSKDKLEREEHVEIIDELDAELEKLLQTNPLEGLTDAQVAERLQHFGRNGIALFFHT